ncbi:MAG: hypothetical protein HND49_08340 [Planctomycetes bacterium]|nr:hypothetical protein [Planctomycetota bacterium]
MQKQHEIMELLDNMISDAVDEKPDKNKLTSSYYVETITTQVKLLARILKERG